MKVTEMTVTVPGPDSCPPDGLALGPGPGDRPDGLVAGDGRGAELAIWTDQSANRCTLRLRGRLTADTVSLLDHHVDRLGCRWCDEVVIDLSGLESMDCVGARLIVGFGHYTAGRGGRFEIRGARPDATALIDAAEVELSC